MDDGLIWLASYPKSGNTWLRCLLEAYRHNGQLDINDMRSVTGDSGRTMTQLVSPIPAAELPDAAIWLLRPAALFQMMPMMKVPRLLKTHFANMQPVGCAPFIPVPFTEKAIYILRDPRSLVRSIANHFGYSHDQTVEFMNDARFSIGTDKSKDPHTTVYVGGWSAHVKSWMDEKQFPVCLLTYEELLENTEETFKGILGFLGWEYDEARLKRAVKAASLGSLRKAEDKHGFQEKSPKTDRFFNNGGTRWQDDLGPKHIRQIETDHGPMMKKWGYL